MISLPAHRTARSARLPALAHCAFCVCALGILSPGAFHQHNREAARSTASPGDFLPRLNFTRAAAVSQHQPPFFAHVLEDVVGNGELFLTAQAGDEIRVTRTDHESGWWVGELQHSNGTTSGPPVWFDPQHVKPVPDGEGTRQEVDCGDARSASTSGRRRADADALERLTDPDHPQSYKKSAYTLERLNQLTRMEEGEAGVVEKQHKLVKKHDSSWLTPSPLDQHDASVADGEGDDGRAAGTSTIWTPGVKIQTPGEWRHIGDGGTSTSIDLTGNRRSGKRESLASITKNTAMHLKKKFSTAAKKQQQERTPQKKRASCVANGEGVRAKIADKNRTDEEASPVTRLQRARALTGTFKGMVEKIEKQIQRRTTADTDEEAVPGTQQRKRACTGTMEGGTAQKKGQLQRAESGEERAGADSDRGSFSDLPLVGQLPSGDPQAGKGAGYANSSMRSYAEKYLSPEIAPGPSSEREGERPAAGTDESSPSAVEQHGGPSHQPTGARRKAVPLLRGPGISRLGPSDRSHLRLGIEPLGMVHICAAIGFLRLRQERPRCSSQTESAEEARRRTASGSRGSSLRQKDWVLTEWDYIYKRPEGKSTQWIAAAVAKDDPTAKIDDAVCYDLAMAIKDWLQKPENIGYMGLSMCEVALIDDRFKSARPFVKEATVFWSHVQLESVNKLFTNLIENGGGGDDQGAAFRKTEAKEKGIWPKKSVWLDMFSLRQNAQGGDFDAAEMLELIGSIGHVSATANNNYFTRSFCLLESYAVVAAGGQLRIHNVSSDRTRLGSLPEVKSAQAAARHIEDAEKVRMFVRKQFRKDGDDKFGSAAFAAFDEILQTAIIETWSQHGEYLENEAGYAHMVHGLGSSLKISDPSEEGGEGANEQLEGSCRRCAFSRQTASRMLYVAAVCLVVVFALEILLGSAALCETELALPARNALPTAARNASTIRHRAQSASSVGRSVAGRTEFQECIPNFANELLFGVLNTFVGAPALALYTALPLVLVKTAATSRDAAQLMRVCMLSVLSFLLAGLAFYRMAHVGFFALVGAQGGEGLLRPAGIDISEDVSSGYYALLGVVPAATASLANLGTALLTGGALATCKERSGAGSARKRGENRELRCSVNFGNSMARWLWRLQQANLVAVCGQKLFWIGYFLVVYTRIFFGPGADAPFLPAAGGLSTNSTATKPDWVVDRRLQARGLAYLAPYVVSFGLLLLVSVESIRSPQKLCRRFLCASFKERERLQQWHFVQHMFSPVGGQRAAARRALAAKGGDGDGGSAGGREQPRGTHGEMAKPGAAHLLLGITAEGMLRFLAHPEVAFIVAEETGKVGSDERSLCAALNRCRYVANGAGRAAGESPQPRGTTATTSEPEETVDAAPAVHAARKVSKMIVKPQRPKNFNEELETVCREKGFVTAKNVYNMRFKHTWGANEEWGGVAWDDYCHFLEHEKDAGQAAGAGGGSAAGRAVGDRPLPSSVAADALAGRGGKEAATTATKLAGHGSAKEEPAPSGTPSGVTGVGVRAFLQTWLRKNNHAGKSVAEVILCDARFKELKHNVGPAEIVFSHLEDEDFLTKTMRAMADLSSRRSLRAHDSTDFEDSAADNQRPPFFWLDHASMRPCHADFEPHLAAGLVRQIGRLVVSVDRDFAVLNDTKCLFDLYVGATYLERQNFHCDFEISKEQRSAWLGALNELHADVAGSSYGDEQVRRGILDFIDHGSSLYDQVPRKVFDATVTGAVFECLRHDDDVTRDSYQQHTENPLLGGLHGGVAGSSPPARTPLQRALEVGSPRGAAGDLGSPQGSAKRTEGKDGVAGRGVADLTFYNKTGDAKKHKKGSRGATGTAVL